LIEDFGYGGERETKRNISSMSTQIRKENVHGVIHAKQKLDGVLVEELEGFLVVMLHKI
jgi:hypothetical protein